jgi:hypothetical protein
VHVCGGIELDGCPGTLEHFIDAQAEYQETWQRGHRQREAVSFSPLDFDDVRLHGSRLLLWSLCLPRLPSLAVPCLGLAELTRRNLLRELACRPLASFVTRDLDEGERTVVADADGCLFRAKSPAGQLPTV